MALNATFTHIPLAKAKDNGIGSKILPSNIIANILSNSDIYVPDEESEALSS